MKAIFPAALLAICILLPMTASEAASVNILSYGGDPSGAAYSDQAFTRALEAVKAGGVINIPEGTFRIKEDMLISGSNIEINGRGTVFVKDNGKADNTKIKITGTHVKISGITITSDAAARTGYYGLISAVDARDLKLTGLDISGSPSVAVYTINTKGIVIDRCRVHDTKADGIHISRASEDVVIENCLIERTGDDCIGLVSYDDGKYGQNRRIVIRNNILRESNGSTRGIASSSSDVIIENNVICGLPKAGIIIFRSVGIWKTHFPENVIIRNNRIFDIGYGKMMDSFAGICVNYCRNVDIYDNEISRVRADGVAVCYAVDDVRIRNNRISDCRRGIYIVNRYEEAANKTAVAFLYAGHDNPPAKAGIENILIEGNKISGCSVCGIAGSGRYDCPLKNITIRDNVLSGNLTGNNEDAADIFVRNAEKVVCRSNYSVDMGPEQKPQPYLYYQDFDNVKGLEYVPYKRK